MRGAGSVAPTLPELEAVWLHGDLTSSTVGYLEAADSFGENNNKQGGD